MGKTLLNAISSRNEPSTEIGHKKKLRSASKRPRACSQTQVSSWGRLYWTSFLFLSAPYPGLREEPQTNPSLPTSRWIASSHFLSFLAAARRVLWFGLSSLQGNGWFMSFSSANSFVQNGCDLLNVIRRRQGNLSESQWSHPGSGQMAHGDCHCVRFLWWEEGKRTQIWEDFPDVWLA